MEINDCSERSHSSKRGISSVAAMPFGKKLKTEETSETRSSVSRIRSFRKKLRKKKKPSEFSLNLMPSDLNNPPLFYVPPPQNNRTEFPSPVLNTQEFLVPAPGAPSFFTPPAVSFAKTKKIKSKTKKYKPSVSSNCDNLSVIHDIESEDESSCSEIESAISLRSGQFSAGLSSPQKIHALETSPTKHAPEGSLFQMLARQTEQANLNGSMNLSDMFPSDGTAETNASTSDEDYMKDEQDKELLEFVKSLSLHDPKPNQHQETAPRKKEFSDISVYRGEHSSNGFTKDYDKKFTLDTTIGQKTPDNSPFKHKEIAVKPRRQRSFKEVFRTTSWYRRNDQRKVIEDEMLNVALERSMAQM